jgi:uncharacterized protein (DUF433 family)
MTEDDVADRIVSTADTLSGAWRVAGTRISVELILEALAGGDTPEDVVETYPVLTVDDVRAALEFARSAWWIAG